MTPVEPSSQVKFPLMVVDGQPREAAEGVSYQCTSRNVHVVLGDSYATRRSHQPTTRSMANKRVREACVCVQPEVAGVGLAGVRICAGRFGVTSTSQKSRAREREDEGARASSCQARWRVFRHGHTARPGQGCVTVWREGLRERISGGGVTALSRAHACQRQNAPVVAIRGCTTTRCKRPCD